MAYTARFKPLDIIGAVLLVSAFASGASLYTSSVRKAAIAADIQMAAAAPANVAEQVAEAEAEADTEVEPQAAAAEPAVPAKAVERAEPAFHLQTMRVRTDLNFDEAQAYYASGKAEVHHVTYEPPQTEIAPVHVAPAYAAKAPVHKEPKPVQVAEKPWEQMSIEEKNTLSEKLGGKICPGVKGRPVWASQFMINMWLRSMNNVEELKASIKKNCGRAMTGIKTGVNPFLSAAN